MFNMLLAAAGLYLHNQGLYLACGFIIIAMLIGATADAVYLVRSICRRVRLGLMTDATDARRLSEED